MRFEILVSTRSSPLLATALDEFEMTTTTAGCVRLAGDLPDQSALVGICHRLVDLRIEILEIRRLDPRTLAPGTHP